MSARVWFAFMRAGTEIITSSSSNVRVSHSFIASEQFVKVASIWVTCCVLLGQTWIRRGGWQHICNIPLVSVHFGMRTQANEYNSTWNNQIQLFETVTKVVQALEHLLYNYLWTLVTQPQQHWCTQNTPHYVGHCARLTHKIHPEKGKAKTRAQREYDTNQPTAKWTCYVWTIYGLRFFIVLRNFF